MTNCISLKTQSAEKAISDCLGKQLPNFEQIEEINHLLSKFDKEKGWPPRVHSKISKKFTPSDIHLVTPNVKRFRKATKYALSNQKVLEFLGEHWIHVFTQHITQTHYKYHGVKNDIKHFEFRVLFYSYSTKQAVEVLIGGEKKMVINPLFDIYIPETYEEIQIAIKLAKEDERISSCVCRLEANAILEPLTDEKHPSFENRVMRVMFSEKYDDFKELPVLYCALVDLNEKKVLTAAESPCIQ